MAIFDPNQGRRGQAPGEGVSQAFAQGLQQGQQMAANYQRMLQAQQKLNSEQEKFMAETGLKFTEQLLDTAKMAAGDDPEKYREIIEGWSPVLTEGFKRAGIDTGPAFQKFIANNEVSAEDKHKHLLDALVYGDPSALVQDIQSQFDRERQVQDQVQKQYEQEQERELQRFVQAESKTRDDQVSFDPALEREQAQSLADVSAIVMESVAKPDRSKVMIGTTDSLATNSHYSVARNKEIEKLLGTIRANPDINSIETRRNMVKLRRLTGVTTGSQAFKERVMMDGAFTTNALVALGGGVKEEETVEAATTRGLQVIMDQQFSTGAHIARINAESRVARSAEDLAEWEAKLKIRLSGELTNRLLLWQISTEEGRKRSKEEHEARLKEIEIELQGKSDQIIAGAKWDANRAYAKTELALTDKNLVDAKAKEERILKTEFGTVEVSERDIWKRAQQDPEGFGSAWNRHVDYACAITGQDAELVKIAVPRAFGLIEPERGELRIPPAVIRKPQKVEPLSLSETPRIKNAWEQARSKKTYQKSGDWYVFEFEGEKYQTKSGSTFEKLIETPEALEGDAVPEKDVDRTQRDVQKALDKVLSGDAF